MSSTINQVEHMNACLEELPELKLSNIARYPLELPSWVNPSAKINGKIPAFIPYPAKDGEKVELLQDYVWGPNTHGMGYYHVWTKQAYRILTNRVTKELHRTAKLFRRYAEEEKLHRSKLMVAREILVVRSESYRRPNEFDPTHLDVQRHLECFEYVNNGKITIRTAIGGSPARILC